MSRGHVGLALIGLVTAVSLRVWTLLSPIGGLDADEAVWGLMTMHALDGDLNVFFWDQNYGGTQEVLLSVPVFAAAGAGVASVRFVPIVLFVLAVALVWRIGRRTIGEPAATAAAVFFAIWPGYLVWKSTRAHGFYGVGLVLTLLVVLLALRLVDRPRTLEAVLLGLVMGLGWWATPQTVLVIIPALAWLAFRLRGRTLSLWPSVPAAIAGAAPWVGWNLLHGFESLETPFEPGNDTYVDHVRTFFFATFPTMLGVRIPFTLEWVPHELVGRAVEAAAFAALVGLVFRGGGRALLGTVAVAYPLLQSISPYAFLNEEPRYLVFLAPVLALALADLAARTVPRALVTGAVLVVLSVVGLRGMMDVEPPVPTVGRERVPADLGPALRALDRLGEDHVRATYAVAYRITFESRERIIAASTSAVRYERYQRLVDDPFPTYVFVKSGAAERTQATSLRGYRAIVAGDWSIYVYAGGLP